jgi:B9 domain-containing protein 2
MAAAAFAGLTSRKDAEVEIFILGEVSHGEGFKAISRSRGILCEISALVDGSQESQWQPLSKQTVSMTCFAGANKFETTQETMSSGGQVVWNHPIDLHYATSSIAEWPRLRFRVLAVEAQGRSVPIAYGTAVVPSTPGEFKLQVQTWRLAGSFWQEMTGALPLGIPEIAALDTRASALRAGLSTVASGVIHIQGEVILRKFSTYGVNAGA